MTPTFWRGPRCQLTPAPASSFSSPADFGSDLWGWWKSGTGLLNASGSPASNGEAISQWTDQSGNGWNLLQGTASRQPLYTASDTSYNNKGSLSSDGNNRLELDIDSDGSSELPQPFTIFFVGDWGTDQGGASQDLWEFWRSGVAKASDLQFDGDLSGLWRWTGDSSGAQNYNVGSATPGPNFHTHIHDNPDFAAYAGRTEYAIASVVTTLDMNFFDWPAFSDTLNFSGAKMVEAFILSKAATTEELSNGWGYIEEQFGL